MPFIFTLALKKRLLYVTSMEKKKKNRAAQALGKRGGKVKSAAKTEAARKSLEANRLKRWPAKVEPQDEPEVTE